VAWQLTVGPPGSGRTTRMVDAAREACSRGQRVWWVGLPAQRAYVLHRITEGGYTALGLEFMSSQQMYYRLLTHANLIRPMLVGSAALVRVGEALKQVSGELPTPGEARLFWRGLPLDYYEQTVTGLQEVPAEEVQGAAERYLDPSYPHIVLVGDPEIIRPQVSELGLGEIVEREPVAELPPQR